VLVLPMLLGAFHPPKPDSRICCDTPSPGLCEVFELD
jgi:hypothetical protein